MISEKGRNKIMGLRDDEKRALGIMSVISSEPCFRTLKGLMEGLPPSEIAERQGITRQAVQKHIKRLLNVGLIKKKVEISDGKITTSYIVPKGVGKLITELISLCSEFTRSSGGIYREVKETEKSGEILKIEEKIKRISRERNRLKEQLARGIITEEEYKEEMGFLDSLEDKIKKQLEKF
ncbi:hypothetical protein DRN46_01470 [Thermococci archaeon]|nr:MAG: hypothetical protein DRN46_01470 [Thermococci archaeon]RLF94675.1 MAG: hypothetical protein DRN52_04825 [Thermococci archaeon]